MIFESAVKVRYAETDKMGVVYHANYLVWFEIARTELLEQLGYPYEKIEEQGFISPVLKAEINYGSPLRYGDTAIVRVRLIELSGVKSTYYYEIYKSDQDMDTEEPCCSGKTTHCMVEEHSFKPVSLKRLIPELYQTYQSILEPL